MRESKENAFSYLQNKLTTKNIVKAFIFGSFITDIDTPNDCDIFIVTNQFPNNSNWTEFLNLVSSTKIEFFEKFGLPLNASINTEKEFTEESAFKTRILSKTIIEIIPLSPLRGLCATDHGWNSRRNIRNTNALRLQPTIQWPIKEN